MIYSRSTQPKDVGEKMQLALHDFFTTADKLSVAAGPGGMQRLDIQVVDGCFNISWVHGPRHATTVSGSKIQQWTDIPFIPKG